MSRPRFDPYALLHELHDRNVTSVIVGGLARVLRGSDELTRNIDITPHDSAQNLGRLQRALDNVGARRSDGRDLDLSELDPTLEPVLRMTTNLGEGTSSSSPPAPAATTTSAAAPPTNRSAKASVPGSRERVISSACSKRSAATTTAS
jgi:hypothetical protein